MRRQSYAVSSRITPWAVVVSGGPSAPDVLGVLSPPALPLLTHTTTTPALSPALCLAATALLPYCPEEHLGVPRGSKAVGSHHLASSLGGTPPCCLAGKQRKSFALNRLGSNGPVGWPETARTWRLGPEFAGGVSGVGALARRSSRPARVRRERAPRHRLAGPVCLPQRAWCSGNHSSPASRGGFSG
jgi:hypothetical protein